MQSGLVVRGEIWKDSGHFHSAKTRPRSVLEFPGSQDRVKFLKSPASVVDYHQIRFAAIPDNVSGYVKSYLRSFWWASINVES